MKRITIALSFSLLFLYSMILFIGCEKEENVNTLTTEPVKQYYTLEDFKSIVINKSTFQDICTLLSLKTEPPTQQTSYGWFCEFPTQNGGYICVEFKGTDMVVFAIEEVRLPKFEAGTYSFIDLDEPVTACQDPAVPNHETALSVAQAIFDKKEKSKKEQGYTPQVVYYDEKDEIWIVSFWKRTIPVQVGGDCNIAIRKSDGKILKIWYGE